MKLCNIQGEIITPNDIDYDRDRQEWNRAIQKFPAVIAYCENERDVQNAVVCAQDIGLPIRIRSGGHNYEGYSVGHKAFVIDVSEINNIGIDHERGIVQAGGGVKNRQLYNAISTQGYPFPGGTCPTVGVSGYALGGGWGLSARRYGLGCDSLLQARVVDYRGCALTASAECNPDLFWALRGAGGGNFGVVTEMTFKLPQKVGDVTYFELFYPQASVHTQLQFLDTFQRWITSTSRDINAQGGVYNSREDGIYAFMRGICYGHPTRTRQLLSPFYFTSDLQETFEYASFYDVITRIENGYPSSEKFKSTGRFVNRIYSERELFNLLIPINAPRPEGSILTSLSVYGLGGKVADVLPRETAFFFRNANYIILIQSVWENNAVAASNQSWVLRNFPPIYRVTEGSYINFPLLQLPCYMADYFGGNARALERIKSQYDPCDVFTFPQSIPPA